jgi:hypothetical protein
MQDIGPQAREFRACGVNQGKSTLKKSGVRRSARCAWNMRRIGRRGLPPAGKCKAALMRRHAKGLARGGGALRQALPAGRGDALPGVKAGKEERGGTRLD